MNAKLLSLFLLLVFLNGCWPNNPGIAKTPWGELQPRVGGMVLPVERPVQAAPNEVGAEAPDQLQIGQMVVAVDAINLRLYADATTRAPVLEVYPAGALFTVVEPSGAYTTYPVQREARTWYRLQAADGLVGWALIDAVVVESVAPPR